jgi:hypothetical protein
VGQIYLTINNRSGFLRKEKISITGGITDTGAMRELKRCLG